MFIIKNALTNIMCSKGRNVLIGIIVLVIAISSSIAISVKEAAKKAEKNELSNLSVTASILPDREKIMENAKNNNENFRESMQNISSLSLEDMQTYAKSSYVDDFHYSMQSSINGSENFQAVTDEENSTNDNSNSNSRPDGIGGMNFSQGDFTIIGYSNYSAMTNFVSGSNKVTDGEILDLEGNENECIISTQLADFNNLNIGDKITLTNPSAEDQNFDFVITGFYTYTSENNSEFNMGFSSAMDPANQIYTSFKSLNEIVTDTKENSTTSVDDNGREQTTALRGTVNSTYVFSSIEKLNNFKKDVKTMGLSSDYKVSSTDVSNYEASILPIKNTAKFANMMLWLILSIGGIILIVLNMFNIRERKYEVGVLTAIGMKKSKVTLQFVTELFVVTFISIIIGTGIGAVLSVPLSNNLLESQISSQEKENTQQAENFGRPNSPERGQPNLPNNAAQSDIDYINTLDATTDFNVVMKLIGIGILLIIVSSLAAVIFVMRYEPLKILSERT